MSGFARAACVRQFFVEKRRLTRSTAGRASVFEHSTGIAGGRRSAGIYSLNQRVYAD